MSRILFTAFIGFGFALSGCQPTKVSSSATPVKAAATAPYAGTSGQPIPTSSGRPGTLPPPPQQVIGPAPVGGGLPPQPMPSAPVPVPMPAPPIPSAPMPIAGPSGPAPLPAPMPAAPMPVASLPPPPFTGPSSPINTPSLPTPGVPQTVTPTTTIPTFPTVSNTPPTPSNGPLTYIPSTPTPASTTPTQPVTPTPTPVNNVPAPTQPSPFIPTPAAPVTPPSQTEPLAPTPTNVSPVVNEPPAAPTPVVAQPPLQQPAPYIPPPTPATQNAPAAALPPPPPAPPQGAPVPPAPVGTNWANIPNPMQSKFAVCNGGQCPDQKVIPPAPMAKEDCRLTQSCAPIVPPATPSNPPPQAPTAPVAQPAPQAPAAPISKAGPGKKEAYGPAYVKPEDRGCSPIPLKITPVEKLDILIVMDTSASMRGGHENGIEGELGLLIPDMDAFARQLDTKTDIRIGMLLGHAPATKASPHNIHGKLFQADASDPAVINYTEIKRECAGNTSCVKNKVAKILKHKMEHLPNDHTDAQGEALFSSLYDAVTNKELRQNIKRQGLLRKDAFLVVMTVSDEQEVCFDYSSVPSLQPAQVKLFDPKTHKMIGRGTDPHETRFYNNYCKTAANGEPLTYPRVYQALKNLKGGDESKFKVMGIHYKNKDVPVAMQDKWEEMEQGHGYLDLIQMSKGRVADMAQVNRFDHVITFVKQLKDLGKYTNLTSIYHGYWDCKSNIHPEAVNISTVEVHVYDSQKHQDVALFGGECAASGANCVADFTGPAVSDIAYDKSGKYPYLQVSVDIDDLSQALQKANFKEGMVYIYFKPRSDVDVNTGLQKR